MKVVEITDPETPVVQQFFEKCRSHNFVNNISAKTIKFNWVVNERFGKFWGILDCGSMIGMAGCHWMPEIHDLAFRILFRGCELPGADKKKTLSRSHFNSMNFREVIPYQLEWVRSLRKGYKTSSILDLSPNQRLLETISRFRSLKSMIPRCAHSSLVFFAVIRNVLQNITYLSSLVA